MTEATQPQPLPAGPVGETPFARFLVRRRTLFLLLVTILLLVFAQPTATGLLLALPLAVIGEAIRIWSAGYIAKSVEVTQGGPYAHVRNPLYLGSLFIALAYCAASGLWWSWPLAIGGFFLFHLAAIRAEERFLRARFGETYERYCRAVPCLFPRLSPARLGQEEQGRFSIAHALRNRQLRYSAVTALVLLGFALNWWLRG